MIDTIERLARVETKVESIDEKVNRVDSQVGCMGKKVSEIHATVVSNKTDANWTKRLMIIIISFLIGGGSFIGWRSLTGDSDSVAAKPPIKVELSEQE